MILKKEYRFIYGVSGYFEDILKELNATVKVKGKGTLREYFAEIDSIKIIAKIKYEKREITFLSKALGKIPITKVEIEITERGIDTERSKKICERIAKRLHFMTMRFGG